MTPSINLFKFLLLFPLGLPLDTGSEINHSPVYEQNTDRKTVIGAERTEMYLPLLKDKRIGLIVNQTSLIAGVHLADTLLSSGVQLLKILAPEHGFRGDADAGEKIENGRDAKTGLPVVSLYGKNKKPSPTDLSDIDLLIFDIQDVGARFFTYISTMHYAMEACAENGKQFIVLDRPNPNGNYVDGPVLKAGFQSFVGMHPVPVVHGLTIGELAGMINNEGWLTNGMKCDLTVIVCTGYEHSDDYECPVKPSPNLPTYQSIKLYPSLCFFEGTIVSVGRGTPHPFECAGVPKGDPQLSYHGLELTGNITNFNFTPVSMPGMAKNPLYENMECEGILLRAYQAPDKLDLQFLMAFYKKYGAGRKEGFFNDFFDKLAGENGLRKDILSGKTETQIRGRWQKELSDYKSLRKKYLLYPDFE